MSHNNTDLPTVTPALSIVNVKIIVIYSHCLVFSLFFKVEVYFRH